MDWLNYHHLFYFWTVAKEGTVSAAAEQLHLARPTVTSQVRALENSIGHKLFEQRGRGLVLTEMGRQIFQYAEEIFAIGHELREFLRSGAGVRRSFRVGMPDVLPKLIAFELLKPALQIDPVPKMECYEGTLSKLLGNLALHKLDLVLSDSPAPNTLDVNVYSHKLGQCGTSLLASESLAARYRDNFPQSLNGAPMLLPTRDTSMRRSLDRWMYEREIYPDVVAEFQDSALMKVFGQASEGIFAVPAAIEDTVKRQYNVTTVGRLPEVIDEFYAISVEKRVHHEATLTIVNQARSKLFDDNPE